MTTLQKRFALLFFCLCLSTTFIGAQDQISYEVNKVYPYLSIHTGELANLHSINDIKSKTRDNNLSYNPSWVKQFIAVEITATHEGNPKSAISHNDILTTAQKDIIRQADVGTPIQVKVRYIPANNLAYNEHKNLSFDFEIEPSTNAQFPGGEKTLYSYLTQNAISKIADNSFQGYDLTAIQFTINEQGEIENAHIFGADYSTSKDDAVNNLLLNAVRSMPCWTPATYADGTTTSQEYVLTVGNMENCMVHLLNIAH